MLCLVILGLLNVGITLHAIFVSEAKDERFEGDRLKYRS
jgi:hypothetical protein